MATQAQIDDLFEKMQEERAALLAALADVDEEQAEVQPPEGEGEEGWSSRSSSRTSPAWTAATGSG